jgi:hypothetical protein
MGQYIHHPLEVSPVYLSTISIENANDTAHTLASQQMFRQEFVRWLLTEKER